MVEADFNRAVNKKLNPDKVFSWKINDNFQGGVPDNWYIGLNNGQNSMSGKKLPLFVEYKYLKTLPKRENTLIIPALSLQQLDWLRMLVNSGHQALVIVGANFGRSNLGVVFEYPEWEDGVTLTEFTKRAIDYTGLANVIQNRVFCVDNN